MPFKSMMPTVVFPPTTPLTDQATAGFVVPLIEAENCRLSPARIVALEGAIFIGFAAAPGPPVRPPPQPVKKVLATRKITPASIAGERFVEVISDPLS
jgi:hypothetical protein